jgi:hypothetical protein
MDTSHYRNFAITPSDLVFYFDRASRRLVRREPTVYVPRNAIPPLAV